MLVLIFESALRAREGNVDEKVHERGRKRKDH